MDEKPSVVASSAAKMKRIVVHFLPSIGLEPEVYETPGKAGYHIHSDENGPIGYRVYTDSQTVLFPAKNVLKIVTAL